MTTLKELIQQVVEKRDEVIDMRDKTLVEAKENPTVEQMTFLRGLQKAIEAYDFILAATVLTSSPEEKEVK